MRPVPIRNPYQYYYCRFAACLLAVLLTISQVAQASIWVSGANTINQPGAYGNIGEPNSDNVPGGREGGICWIDDSGSFWLFGGYGYDGSGSFGLLNDLWMFDDPNWTWVSGSNTRSQSGVYGTQGVADPTNVPGARTLSVSWTDGSGNLWLFGGYGYGRTADTGSLNDLWKFEDPNWIWVKGSSTVDQQGTYGVQGVAHPMNVPGARDGSISWTDTSGNFWLFGGYGYGSSASIGRLNDLWMFDGGLWTWVSGSSTINQPGVYETEGIPHPNNMPGARDRSSCWIDDSDNLWLFGGFGYSDDGLGYLNDLWEFDGANWAWVSGPNTTDQAGVYGTKAVPDANNIPGARRGGNSWIDGSGQVWLFGGYGYDSSGSLDRLNDLWKFDVTGREWTWVSGSSTINQPGVYGTKGMGDSENQPGARENSNAWIDLSSDLWLFGGYGYDSSAAKGHLNDLWKFERFCDKPPGDINLDCKFDLVDFALMAPHWLEDNWHY